MAEKDIQGGGGAARLGNDWLVTEADQLPQELPHFVEFLSY